MRSAGRRGEQERELPPWKRCAATHWPRSRGGRELRCVVPGGGGGGGPEEVGTEQGGDGGGDGVLLTGCRGDDIRGWAAAWVADGGGALRAALIPFAGQRAEAWDIPGGGRERARISIGVLWVSVHLTYFTPLDDGGHHEYPSNGHLRQSSGCGGSTSQPPPRTVGHSGGGAGRGVLLRRLLGVTAAHLHVPDLALRGVGHDPLRHLERRVAQLLPGRNRAPEQRHRRLLALLGELLG